MSSGPQSLPEVVRTLRSMPEGTTFTAAAVVLWLAPLVDAEPEVETEPASPSVTWQERLWTCPAETRLTLRDACEALGRSSSWVYKRTGAGATGVRLPCRKLEGELYFIARELRDWIAEHEDPHPHRRAG